MKKILAATVALIMVSSAVWAAGGKDAGAKDSMKKEVVIGYTVQSMENDFFVSVVQGMKDHAAELGIKLIVADAAADASKHIDQINNFIAQDVDAILISPVDQTAPETAVKRAVDAGIPVVSLNQLVKGSSASLLMKEYEYGFMGGTIAGKWLNAKESDGSISKILNKKGEIEVAVVRYDTIASLIDRSEGLKQGITKNYTGKKKINFVFEQDGADSAAGLKIAETAYTANPDISIFVCINDSSALGVFEAASAISGKNKDNTCIVGLDGLPQALKYISQNTMYKGTVDLSPVKLGGDGLDLALEVIQKGPIAEPRMPTMKMVTIENIADYKSVIK
ncbi:substrate-binding domain-containing protein [Treponema sp.]